MQTDVDPDVQRIIDQAAPGIQEVMTAYEQFEGAYFAAAQTTQSTIVAGYNSTQF